LVASKSRRSSMNWYSSASWRCGQSTQLRRLPRTSWVTASVSKRSRISPTSSCWIRSTMLIRLWAGHTQMALRPDIEHWARDALDWIARTHHGSDFNEVHVDVAGQTIGVSCTPNQTEMFTRAFVPASSEVVDSPVRVRVSNSLPEMALESQSDQIRGHRRARSCDR